MAEIEAGGEVGDGEVDNDLEVIDQDGGEVKSAEEKMELRFEAIKDLSEALERIKSAMEKTSCGYCVRDLTIAELLIENILLLMVDLVSETEKKDRKG